MRVCNFPLGRCWVAAILLLGVDPASAKRIAFDSATVTRVENQVSVGEITDGRAGARRPTSVSDVIKANHFVQTGGDSRAELQFKDSSLVRVGQNSIFSFEASSRSLSLDKGDMLFYMAPGNGVGTIKTPALTAGITGTLCKVATDMIAVLRGSITLKVGGRPVKIPAGYAVKAVNGKVRIFKFDPRVANKGKLYSMGPLPEGPGIQITQDNTELYFPGSHDRNAIDAGQVNPNLPRPPPPPPPQRITTQPQIRTIGNLKGP